MRSPGSRGHAGRWRWGLSPAPPACGREGAAASWETPAHWQPPPCRGPAPSGPPLSHPSALGGQMCSCGWTQNSADPCLDHCCRRSLARTPLESPRAGPPHHVGLCKSKPHLPRAISLWGAAPRDLRICCPPISGSPSRDKPHSPCGSHSPRPTQSGLNGVWGEPPLFLGAPPALAGSHQGVCTTCTHLPYPGRSLPAPASSCGPQARRGTWPCSPCSPPAV